MRIKHNIALSLFIIFVYAGFAQTDTVFYRQFKQARVSNADSTQKYYFSAFNEMQDMLENKQPLSFKRAVFITENAYLENHLNYEYFVKEIDLCAKTCKAFLKSNRLLYNQSDSVNVSNNAAIFKFMTDTIWLTSKIPFHFPFTYDFQDYNGEMDWSKMFVTKLMETGTGNCHSLPFLYRILAEELNAKAYLSLAPSHIFIKNYCKSTAWYNTELTSAMFPVDAWVAASGYVTLEAMQNGIYMDTLSLKQSLAICAIDMAKGFERKYKTNSDEFVLQCCDLALKYYPNYVNAMLLKAETLKSQFDKIMVEKKATYPKEIFTIPEAKQKFDEMEKLYVNVLTLGYREMPEKMYKEWLLSLKENEEKYQDKKIIFKFNAK